MTGRETVTIYPDGEREAIEALLDGVMWRCYTATFIESPKCAISLADQATWPESWGDTMWGNTNPVLNCALYFGVSIREASEYVIQQRHDPYRLTKEIAKSLSPPLWHLNQIAMRSAVNP